MRTVLINVRPHPQFKGDWLVQCNELLPNGIWYKSRENAIYYAKLLGKDNAGEIRVLNHDGGTALLIPLLTSGLRQH